VLHGRRDREEWAQGFEHSELARMRRAGSLAQVRRGAYAAETPAEPENRHRQLVAATVPLLAGDACVSHQSAAVLHGLPAWPDLLSQVHVI
jgi:predicted transcriptional regulator of viral defense system